MKEGFCMKNWYRFITVIVVMMLSFVLMSLQSFAEDVSLYDDLLYITDDLGNGGGNESKYTATAPANDTNTVYMYNDGESEAIIQFDYSFSNCNSYTINGTTPATSGTYSTVVEAGGELNIAITSKKYFKATVTLTNITYSPLEPFSNIKYDFDVSLGTVTVNGVNVNGGSTVTIEAPSAEVVATPASGAKFIAWVDEYGKIIPEGSTYTQYSTGDKTIKALFSKNTAYFKANDYIFDDLNKASEKGNTVVLICDGILPKGDYVIPKGVTLLIPFDDDNKIYTNKPECVNQTYAKPSPYRTLTMASGANITVNGAISIPAKQCASIGSNGSPIGNYGVIIMNNESTITVNNGGNLYAWGYIAGSGTITAKSGSTIYEDFQVRDWRGGNATTDMINNSQKVFPMSQYYVQNIQVPMTLEAGAIENGYMSTYVTLAGVQEAPIPFIGPNGMFRIQSGYITKDYEEKTDRLAITVNGEISMAPLSISMKLSLLGTKTINSQNYTLPVNGNITLHINSGSKVNVSQDLALLPGSVINVYEGAECVFAKDSSVFIYDNDNWGGYCSQYNKKLIPVNYAHDRKYTRIESDLTDAQIYVAGTVDAYNGDVYTTTSGSNINGAEGGLIKIKPIDPSATYQASQNDTKISYVEIPVISAQPKNADGTYTDPADLKDCCSAYIYHDGKWIPENINHTNVIVTEGIEPTCDEEGKTEGSYCGTCGTVIKEQEVIPALGHNYGKFTFLDKVNHKKVCSNDSTHIKTQPHTFDGFNCSECGCEKIVTDTTYTIDGEKIIINTSFILDVPANTQIIIATYDSLGSLLDISLTTKDLLEEITLPSAGVSMIKVFAWNGFNTMSPISGVEKINVL